MMTHEDVGKFVEITEDVTIASGHVVKKGSKGRIRRCEPAGSLGLCFIVHLVGDLQERGILKGQYRVLEKRERSS